MGKKGNSLIAMIGLIGLFALASIGCTGDGMAETTPRKIFHVSAVPVDSGNCRVSVVIDNPGVDATLNVSLTAERGIQFETGSTNSEPWQISLMAEGKRSREFICHLAQDGPLLTGVYVIRATAKMAGSDEMFAESSGELHVIGRDRGPAVLVSKEVFNQRFGDGFVSGLNNVQYKMVLDDIPYPNQGTLYIRVSSGQENFAPSLYVNVVDGIEFHSTDHVVSVNRQPANADIYDIRAEFSPIARGGLRVIVVPFVLSPDSGAGRYALRTTLVNHDQYLAETAPIYVEVAATNGQSGVAYLSGVTQGQAHAAAPEQRLAALVSNERPVAESAPANLRVGSEQAAVVWDRWTQRGLSGGLWDVYITHVEPRTNITWTQFDNEIRRYNPHLIDDGDVFHPHKSYWLPTEVANLQAASN